VLTVVLWHKWMFFRRVKRLCTQSRGDVSQAG
jgi:hypothetical protein